MSPIARCIILLISIAVVTALVLDISGNKPISGTQQVMIEKAVASLEHLTGTNILEIERIHAKRVRVRTKAESGNGGDLLELQERGGAWVLDKRGAWLN